MDPKEYYYKYFREDFNTLINKLKPSLSYYKDGPKNTFIGIRTLNNKNLLHISEKNYILFHYSLACNTLIDQVMYTYFKNDYEKFQNKTMYPKMGSFMHNSNPWKILTKNNIDLLEVDKFIEFFINDLKLFFNQNDFRDADWLAVKRIMLNDNDINFSEAGRIFKNTLEKY